MNRYVKVALFFIILGSAGVGYMILSSDSVNNFNSRIYYVILPDATGLSTRSKIYLAGIQVGKIQDINLEGTEAHLKVALLKDVAVRGDARISRKASSILGTSILTLDPGTELTPIIQSGGQIRSDQHAADMDAVMGMVNDLGGQISGLLKEFQENQLELLTVSLQTFNSIAQKFDDRSEAELNRVSRILEAAALITERTERLLEERQEDLGASTREIRLALENIRSITGEIRSGQGNLGQAVYDTRLYERLLSTVDEAEVTALKMQIALDSVNTLAANVNHVVDNAGEIVEKAVGLGFQVDTQVRYGFLSEQTRAGASVRLEPRSNDRWYRIGITSAPDGVVSRKITETVDSNKNPISYEDTTETRFSFALDAEIARRYGSLTIRGGLLDSTAGLGIDYQPVRWVSLSGEVFDFKTGAAPNLRGVLTVYPFFDPDGEKPWNWLYIRGGVNDSLSDGRDFFVGGGLRFADREIRGLVGLLPAAAAVK
jgi:phospholipid/cholesterol/gamma-HCH transport system substrate-binding protein